MSRKPAVIDQPPVDEALVREDLAKADQLNRQLARIDERFGDGMPYNRRRLVIECRGLVVTTGEALLGLGKRLIVLKEHEPHGDFLDALREIGIEYTFATRAMKAALKFASPKVAAPQPFAGLGQTKLIELLVLDDEQVEGLAEGETVAGVTLDDVERLSTRELRARLRKERDERARDKDVHERVLKQKNDKIDEYEKRLARRDSGSKQERQQALLEELWTATGNVGGPLLEVERILTAIGELESAENISPALDLARGQVLAFLMQCLTDMRARHGIDVDLEERVTPPWMREAA